jgi:hypothetical protein
MRMLNKILMVAVVTTGVSTSALAQQTYLGNRDDIVIMQPKKTAAGKIETVKQDTKEVFVSTGEKIVQPVKRIEMSNSVSRVSTPVESASMPSTSMTSGSAMVSGVSTVSGDIPPNARPGECYAKVLIPGRYETTTKRIKVADEQRVLNRIVPAKYETTTERIKIKEARQYWKAGRGPITKKNEVTGEILCLVEEPAEYKTIEKRVMIQPEQPEYKTVPARYETVTKQRMVQPENWEWRRILCETNLTSGSVRQIQTALNSKGYSVKVDGRLGNDTLGAINRYQNSNGLASRGITYETLSHLGISLTGM